MADLLNAIAACLSSGNWYAALALALTVPDVCAAFSSEDGKSNAKRYAAWFDENLGHIYGQLDNILDSPILSGADCYALRCALLHQASDDISTQRARRLFRRFRIQAIEPHLLPVIGGRIDGEYCRLTLIIGVQPLCNDILSAARKWSMDNLLQGTSASFKSIFKSVQIHTEEPDIED